MKYKHETYSDDEGRVVFARMPHSTDATPEFGGEGIHQIDAEHGAKFTFVIPGTDIDEAFANWQEAHDAKLALVIAEIAADKRKASTPKIQRATANMIPKMATQRG